MFPSGTFCHRISLPPSLLLDLLAVGDFFRPALLRPETSDSEVHEADLHVGGNPARKQLSMRVPRTALLRRLAFLWARGPLSGDEISYPGSSDTVLLIHPSDGSPRVLLIHLVAHLSFATLRQSLFSTVWVTFLYFQFRSHDSLSY